MAEQKAKTIDELNQEDRALLLDYFRAAVRARQAQWDNELQIEGILGREINVDFAYLAAGFDNPTALSFADLRMALGE